MTVACALPGDLEGTSLQSGEFTCSICFELMVDPVVGNCGHAFCKRCMDDWKASRQRLGQTVSCPQCRTNLLPASSTQQFGVCIRLRETISKLFPMQSAARRHEVEEWDKQAACDAERARSSADTSTSTAPTAAGLHLAGSAETMEAYRELTRRVLAALVTTNPEAAAEAVGLLPSASATRRAPTPAEQEQEARERYASLQSSMALLTGTIDVATPAGLPSTPNSRERSPTTPPAVRAQEQAAQQRQAAQQAQSAQQQLQQQAQMQVHAHLQAAQQQQQQAQQQASAAAAMPQQRLSAADATRERQVQAVRRQQQAHEVRGAQLARLLASLIAEGTSAQQQQQQQAQQVVQTQHQAQQQQQARSLVTSQRSSAATTARPQHAQQQAHQTSQHRPAHVQRQQAAPRPCESAQVSPRSRGAQQNQARHEAAVQHHRRQQQQNQAGNYRAQQQQQWGAASQASWVQYDTSGSVPAASYPAMMQPMLVPANSRWPYVVNMPVNMPVSYTMYG